MFPDWFTRPESLYRTLLWIAGPAWAYLGLKAIRRVESWVASTSESNARVSLRYLQKEIENPPSLIGSLGYIICFLPLPFAATAVFLTLGFWPFPAQTAHLDPVRGAAIGREILGIVFFINYLVFGVLTVHGVKVAYSLRHGEAQHAAN
jgi:hypothetical protein